METDQAQCLLLQAGEQVLCPRCRNPLAAADQDIYAPASVEQFRLLLGHLGEPSTGPVGGLRASGDRQLLCPCGAGARSRPGKMILIRSGSWVGWRELGGE